MRGPYPSGVVEQPFRVRGVVEGFYGTPWSHGARLELLPFLGAQGMNAYAYAPKDDAKHRARWREPYDAREMRRFEELVACATDAGVRFGFAVSPGLDIAYDSLEDRKALIGKLRAIADVGVDWFLLLLDDIPLRPDVARSQADLACGLLDALRPDRPAVAVTVCPTEYVGTLASPYLTELGRGLPVEVDVMWTGPTVCSPTITVADAQARAAALGGRAPLIWDNYPVNDGTMAASLHLGPYRGREPGLEAVVAGVLCNPMVQPHASRIALATAGTFFADPAAYDPDTAWRDAVAMVDPARAEHMMCLAVACGDSALSDPSELDLTRGVALIGDEIGGPGWVVAVRALAERLRALRALPAVFAADGDALAAEVAPWATAARVEANAGLAALRLVQQIRPVAAVGDRRGRAVAPDAERTMEHAFRTLFTWQAARANTRSVCGPRFAIYPAVVQLADGRPGLDVGDALREGANAVDGLCRLALDAYAAWCHEPSSSVRVFVDGQERTVATDGTFDATGVTVLLRADTYETRVDGALPFRDRRLV